jgi:quercetin dioxygenase-like cupin family protein
VKTSNINLMTRGWFVGNFEPTIYNTDEVEVAVKNYKMGDVESRHYHKISTEITVIVSGKVKMNNKEYRMGDIIYLEPGEVTDFMALEDTVTTVVKIPGALNDKYEA